MDWVVTLVVGLLGFLGGLDRFSVAERLRARLKTETEIYSALPTDSGVKADLMSHIERQTLLLVAEEEPLTTWEMMDRRWGRFFVYIVGPVLAIQAYLTAEQWAQLASGGLAVAAFVYGQIRIARAQRAVNYRKLSKRILADSDTKDFVSPTAGQVLAAAWKSLLPPYGGSRHPTRADGGSNLKTDPASATKARGSVTTSGHSAPEVARGGVGSEAEDDPQDK